MARSATVIALFCGLALAVGCGGSSGPAPDAGGTADAGFPDAGTPDAGVVSDAGTPDAGQLPDAGACPAPLNPSNDGTSLPASGIPNLILSELSPGSFIELYNTTDSPIALSGVSHALCAPFAYQSLSTLAPSVTVPAKGYATVPWPTFFTSETASGGQVILYANASNFEVSTSILDFVCWGNGTGRRIAQAQSSTGVGKWLEVGCAPAITGGSIHRLPNTPGTSSSDYDTSSPPSGRTCSQ